MSHENVRLYLLYKNQGKAHAAEGNIGAAIKATEKAHAIFACNKIKRRLETLKEFFREIYLEEYDANKIEEVEVVEKEGIGRGEGGHVTLANGFKLSKKLYNNLYPYQKKGIEWLWGLHQIDKGGVLGDDMGLGKTIQIIGFLSGLFDNNTIRSALIVMPVSIIINWSNEFLKWAPNIPVLTFHSESKSQREENLNIIQQGKGVLITSYGMVVSNVDLFKTSKKQKTIWDYVILDEGHKVKNPTKTTKAIHQIPAKHRIVLTGTPIQNNLRELWALYDFCHQGTLLGSLPTFKMQFETIITRSREKNASSGERKLGNMMANSLKQLIDPYFLRRTKQDVLPQQTKDGGQENNSPSPARNTKQISELPQKNDLILWLHLSETQIQIYDDFLNTDHVKDLLMTTKSPLVALTVLKKICDHPRLLSARACLQLGMNGEISVHDLNKILADEETTAPSIDVDHEVLLRESGKLSVLLELLKRLREEGHRTLVFSLSRKMLDIINNILCARDWNVLRLDGTIRRMEDREQVVKLFQNSDMYSVMLLTTQVGGVGLNLTAADRVVIYDPSWNPATDSQAVDRAYRIGQTKPVVVYRLVTCGTVEEKIYRRQIFKDSITRKTTGGSTDPHRYFTSMELRELFTLDNPRTSSTQRQLEEMHAHQRLTYPELNEHLNHLKTLDIFGISDHDLMFKGQFEDTPDHIGNGINLNQEIIQSRVETAKRLLRLESERAHNENVRSGTFCKDLTNFKESPSDLKVADVTHNKKVPPPYHLPGSSETRVETFIEPDVSSDSDEEQTEGKLEDTKNDSKSDPEFSNTLEISLVEYKRQNSVEETPPIEETPPEKEKCLRPEVDGLHLALLNSLNEYKEFQKKWQAQAVADDALDEDLKRALRLSLVESMAPKTKTQEEEEFAKAIELSQASCSQSKSQEEDNLPAAMDRSLSEVKESPFKDRTSDQNLKNLSLTVQLSVDFSPKENLPSEKTKKSWTNSGPAMHGSAVRQDKVTDKLPYQLVDLESEYEHNKNLANFKDKEPYTAVDLSSDTDDDEMLHPYHYPGPSVTKEKNFIESDIPSGSDNELTEAEIKDLENDSQSDPDFARALEISLREYKNQMSAEKTPEKKNGGSNTELDDMHLALIDSLSEYKEYKNKWQTQAVADDAEDEDEDLKRALRLSLEESTAPSTSSQKEKEFVKAPLSQMDIQASTSFFGESSSRQTNSTFSWKSEILTVNLQDSDSEDEFPNLSQRLQLVSSTPKSFLERTPFSENSVENGKRSLIRRIPPDDEVACDKSVTGDSAFLNHTSFLDSIDTEQVTRKIGGRRCHESTTEDEENGPSTSFASDSSNKRSRLSPEITVNSL